MWRFLPSDADVSLALSGQYDMGLVLLSISLAIISACTALEVVDRASEVVKLKTKISWIILGTICLGFGIWCMHFIGMIGFRLPVPIRFDPMWTAISVLPALIASSFALSFLAFRMNQLPSLFASGVIIAAGIGAMHYIGMEAMQAQNVLMWYDPWRFLISIIVAVLLAIVALLAKSKLAPLARFSPRAKNLLAGIVLGIAVSGMHYVAMTATWFLPGGSSLVTAEPINNTFLGIGVAGTLIIIVLIVIVGVAVDRRLQHIKLNSEIVLLPLGIVLVIAVLIYTSSLFVRGIKQEIEREIAANTQAVLTTTAEALIAWQAQHIATVRTWAESPVVSLGTAALLRAGANAEQLSTSPAQADLREWFPSIQRWTGYRGYFVVDLEHRNLASSRDENLGDRNILDSQPEFFEKILQGSGAISRPVKSDVPLRNENGDLEADYPTLFAGAPINNESGQPIAALLFRIDPMVGFVQILRRGRIGETGEIYALDEAGTMLSESRYDNQLRAAGLLAGTQRSILNIRIANPGANLTTGQISFIAPEDRPLTRMAQELTRGITGSSVVPYLDYRGVPVVGAWSWIDELDLGLAIEQDFSEAMISYYFSRNAIVVLTGLAVGVLFLLALMLSLARARQMEANRRTSAILETTLDAVMTWDESGAIESTNPAGRAMFGAKANQLRGRSLETLIPALRNRDYEHVRKFFNVPEGERLKFQMESEGRRLNGKQFPMEISVSEIMLASGEQLFTGILRDISERKKVEAELLDATTERQKMESELNVARNIQINMLPLIFPPFPDRHDVDIFATLKPAREVGGDFYHFFETDSENIIFAVGDVSGKGIPAALFMTLAKTLLESHGYADPSPGKVLTRVNRDLCKGNEENMFVTLFIALVNPRTGKVRYSNGGHNPPLILTDDGEIIRLDNRHGPVIGAVEDLIYPEDEFVMQRGDTLLMYTDGVTEAMDLENNLYGEDKLINVLNSLRFESATYIVETIADQVEYFEVEAEQQADDITIMAIRLVHDGEDEQVLVLELTLDNRIEEINRLNASFQEMASERKVDPSIIQKFKIAFDELLSNIIYYGSDGTKSAEIRIRIEFLNHCIKVAISSFGIPFDPASAETPNTSMSLEERSVGGLGIHIVRNIMDEMAYHRRTNQNVINLLKYLDKDDPRKHQNERTESI